MTTFLAPPFRCELACTPSHRFPCIIRVSGRLGMATVEQIRGSCSWP